MSPPMHRPSRDEVLDAFAVEDVPGRPTLERYLVLYPEYAGELVDLARALDHEVYDDTGPLSAGDQALINSAWAWHAAATSSSAADPFARLTSAQWRDVAQRLDVPRQVMTAFRERRVLLASIPGIFLARLAAALNASVEQIRSAWEIAQPALARSYKSDGKPAVSEPVTFERVLIEAGVPDDKRARLLAEED